jgi:hypothetical protein
MRLTAAQVEHASRIVRLGRACGMLDAETAELLLEALNAPTYEQALEGARRHHAQASRRPCAEIRPHATQRLRRKPQAT